MNATAERGAVAKLQAASHELNRPIDGDSLAAFRAMFGLLMAAYCVHMLSGDYLDALYVRPEVLFSYYGFDWVERASLPVLRVLTGAMLVSALCLAAGFITRIAAALFCVLWTYLFLLEKAYYINHFYLVSLLTFLFVITPGVHGFLPRSIPRISLWVFRAQLGVVYIYAGIAKLQPDWLGGEPMRAFLRPYFATDGALNMAAYGFSWAGLFFDLLVVPGLLWPKTRVAALLFAVGFHLSNRQIFNIDFFPWLAMAGTLLFLPPDWPRHALARIGVLRDRIDRPTAASEEKKSSRFVLGLLCCYFAVQFVVPFHRVLYPGNAHWTEEGQRFSWLLMMKNKVGRAEFTVIDGDSGKSEDINLKRYLNDRQILMLAGDPDMMLQFAHFLADEARSNGVQRVAVFVDSDVSLNGRPSHPMVSEDFDLASAQRKWGHYEWILPLPD